MLMPNNDLAETYLQLRLQLGTYLRRQVRDPAVAEDLLQQLFVKAQVALTSGHHIGNLVGWLYAAARTTVIDYHRANRVQTVELPEDLASSEADDSQLHQQLAACLRPLAEQLPAMYRDTLVATDFMGAAMRDVALQQGVSISAIKSRAARARAMLKESLSECCHIEMSSGEVSDYHPRSGSACRGACC
jgi:RNA polymerase sigma-70 factor, ECF subfamily